MMSNGKISILYNKIQTYNWGSREYISRLLRDSAPSSQPEAELWMGAHPGAPSYIITDNKRLSLLEYIKMSPENILGKHTAGKFNNKLPFLFKVLAADKPLSIQAHPDKSQAEAGFEKENKLKIPLTARHRIYKDNNHKPEIICALTPFTALNGFRPVQDIIDTLSAANSRALDPFIHQLGKFRNDAGLKEFFKSIMTCGDIRKTKIINDILNYSQSRMKNDGRCRWIGLLHQDYPGDIGIMSMFLLNFIELKPGEAMYLPACQFHSYIHGAGIELMANSDNVLRGGLTPKYIDIPELLKIVRFHESSIKIINPEMNENFEKIYSTPSSEFLLSNITINHDNIYESARNRNVEILICLKGNPAICEYPEGITYDLKKGVSVLIPASVSYYTISGPGFMYKATVPVK